MANNLSLSSAFRPTRIIDLPDGTKVEMRALIMGDWALIQEEAAQFVKRDLLQTYLRNLDLLPAEMRDSTIKEVFARAEAITADTITDKQVDAFVESIRGSSLVIWLTMRGARPDLTQEQADAIWSRHRHLLDYASSAAVELSRSKLGNESPPNPQVAGAGEAGQSTGHL